MLILASTTDIVRVITSAAGLVEVHSSWVDLVDGATTSTPDGTPIADITTATTTTIVAAPGTAQTKRNVARLKIKNAHATTSNTITVEEYDGTIASEEIKVTLLAGEMALLNSQGTWFTYDRFGAVKSGPSMIVDPATNDFRLSGVSATPVMIADSTSLSTIFLTQYKGGNIALFDGVNWQLATPAAEVSLAVTGRTTDLPFDIFAFLSAGAVTLEFLNWSSATARATGITRVDGVWTKTGDSTRRYLGSCRARSATSFHHVTAGVNLPVKFDLWNEDNRVCHGFTLRGTIADYAYTLATIRQAGASANYQADVMVGRQEEFLEATLTSCSSNTTISIPRIVGIGFDSTTTMLTGTYGNNPNTVTTAAVFGLSTAQVAHQPTIGRHFYSWNEASVATGACTWCMTKATAGALVQSGMVGVWIC